MRRRISNRQRMIAGVAVIAVAAVIAPVAWSVVGDAPRHVAAPKKCRTVTHGTAPGPAPHPARKTAAKAPAVNAPPADFDNDGHPDLALSGGGDVDLNWIAGSVEVAYGSGDGTGVGRCQYLTQADAGIPGEARDEAEFGFETVARDFDDDGYTDLAAAVFEKDGTHVIILWGSEHGLSSATRVPGTDRSHVPGTQDGVIEEQLAAGDFDGDRHADLVFGLGSEKGLLKGPFQRNGAPADTGPVPAPRLPDRLPSELAYSDLVAGDLNGDGTDDLVSFHTDDDGDSDWSQLHWVGNYLQGGKNGFAKPDSTHIPDAETATVGDVDGDGYADLIVSPRGERASRNSVTVVYGTKSGPGKRTATLDRDTPGVPGKEPQDNDAVFTSLDAGDVNGDGYADVVAGAPRSRVYAARGTEQVLLFQGGPHGLTGKGARQLDQRDVHAIPDKDDNFGESVLLTDMNGDHKADLTVSAPGDDKGRSSAWLLPGSADGLSTQGVTHLPGTSFADPKGDLMMGDRVAR
ncbi:VCBS repeat-containing protein [Streptomyces sp. NPDC002870]|uniref:VCBS repeat-containing protein n=1 Tax=Streptomyces sp. NPDC002870 TaxID=3364666 RepID=UPI003685F9ED